MLMTIFVHSGGCRQGPEPEHQGRPRGTMKQALTMVAEMPGYPMRKLPFAGPETRTKAAISIELFPQHHEHAAKWAR